MRYAIYQKYDNQFELLYESKTLRLIKDSVKHRLGNYIIHDKILHRTCEYSVGYYTDHYTTICMQWKSQGIKFVQTDKTV